MSENINTKSAALGDEVLKRLMQHLIELEEGCLSCSEAFHFLDEYAELVVSRHDAAQLMPYVQRHIDLCPDCGPCFKGLLRILESAAAE